MAKYQFIDLEEQSQDPFAPEKQNNAEFEALLQTEQNTPFVKKYKVGDFITGQVVSVGKDFVFIDLGGKNAGFIACEEFLSAGISLPKQGESVTAYVRQDNGSEISLTRSLKRGDADELLIRNAFEAKIPVEAKVEKVIKGGFEATIGSHRCFVPLSGMELARIENPDIYVGGVFQFHIIEHKNRNIVLSRKSLLREEQEMKAEKVLETLQEGQVFKATITRITNFGAFASLNGLEGLISMNELSQKRVKNAEEIVKLGEIVSVRVLKIDRQSKLRISLSLKDGSEDSQWKEHTDKELKSIKSSSASVEPSAETHIFASAFRNAKKRF